jgi:alpha-N-arabinofuranosidase
MANIAQMINVLQAMILTDKDKMLLTPTYHVFDMYKVHQDATSLPVDFMSPNYTFGTATLPALSVSASKDAAGKVHVSIVNIDPHHDLPLNLALPGLSTKGVTGRILTAPAMDAYNSFDAPNRIAPVPFKGASLKGGQLSLTVPSKSVLVLELN